MKATLRPTQSVRVELDPADDGITARPVPRVTTHRVSVEKQDDGALRSSSPVSIKNQVQEIRSIEDIFDVDETMRQNGATLVYNETNGKYEVRPLQLTDLDEEFDGGTF